MLTTFHALQDLNVLDARGAHVGRVVDLELDPADWRIAALVVRLEKPAAEALGVKRLLGKSTLALKVVHVRAVGDAVLLRETLSELAGTGTGAENVAH